MLSFKPTKFITDLQEQVQHLFSLNETLQVDLIIAELREARIRHLINHTPLNTTIFLGTTEKGKDFVCRSYYTRSDKAIVIEMCRVEFSEDDIDFTLLAKRRADDSILIEDLNGDFLLCKEALRRLSYLAEQDRINMITFKIKPRTSPSHKRVSRMFESCDFKIQMDEENGQMTATKIFSKTMYN